MLLFFLDGTIKDNYTQVSIGWADEPVGGTAAKSMLEKNGFAVRN